MTAISVIIPIKGRVDFLREALASFSHQTNGSFEVIVVNDHSTPSDTNDIKELCASYDFTRCIDQTNEKKGAPAARNLGSEHSTYEYLFFLDSDDLVADTFVESRVKGINEKSDLDMWIYQVMVFNDQPGDTNILWNEFNEKNDLLRFLNTDTVWHTSGPIWRKSFFKKLDGFDEQLISWQDWDLHIRALLEGARYNKYMTAPDVYYRKHASDAISKNNTSDTYFENQSYLLEKTLKSLTNEKGLPSNWRYFAAKLAFNFYSNALKHEYEDAHTFLAFIEEYALISNKEKMRWIKRFKGSDTIWNKVFDKLVRLKYKDHFLETKTTFLNSRWL